MEKDENLKTVEYLRARLLAERAASKAADLQSQHFNTKLTELESQLKVEIKSRKKAEKRLKFLMKKLQSLNLSYVDSLERSTILAENTEISSVSSSSSYTQETQVTNTSKCEIGKRQNCPSLEENWGSSDEGIFGKSTQEDEEQRLKSSVDDNKINNSGNDEDRDDGIDNALALVAFEGKMANDIGDVQDLVDNVDNSMALVIVDSPDKETKEDTSTSNGSVKDMLDTLKYARESLQSSMDMRMHMESNIGQGRVNVISC